MRRVLALVFLVAAAASLPIVAVRGRAQSSGQTAALHDVAWLAGHWVGTTPNGAYIEEMWMPERDGHMIGSFRWERGAGRWLFEFMSLEAAPATSGALTLRLKHFDRAFKGMEEKTESTTFTSTARTSSQIVFELKEGARLVRLTYAKAAGDGLAVTFEETEPGKPPTRLEFPYTRVR